MTIFNHYQNRYEATMQEEYSLQEYLDLGESEIAELRSRYLE